MPNAALSGHFPMETTRQRAGALRQAGAPEAPSCAGLHWQPRQDKKKKARRAAPELLRLLSAALAASGCQALLRGRSHRSAPGMHTKLRAVVPTTSIRVWSVHLTPRPGLSDVADAWQPPRTNRSQRVRANDILAAKDPKQLYMGMMGGNDGRPREATSPARFQIRQCTHSFLRNTHKFI